VDDVVTFVDARQPDVAEVDRPDSIIDFLEAEDLLLERVRDEEQAFLESDRPCVRHPLGNVMARVLDGWDVPRVRTGRRPVQRRGRPASEKLMRAFLVGEDAEPVEGALRGGQVALGWPGGRRLEG
jgi:hypothetical protein